MHAAKTRNTDSICTCGPITAGGEKDLRSDIPTEVQVIKTNISLARGRRAVYATTARVVAITKTHMAACGYVGRCFKRSIAKAQYVAEIAVCHWNVSENKATVRSIAPMIV